MLDGIPSALKLASNSSSPKSRSRKRRWRRKLRKANERWQQLLDNALGQGTYSAASIDPCITVFLLQTEQDTNVALQPLLDTSPTFVALDLEYGHHPRRVGDEAEASSYRAEVDLVQIAHGSSVFLIHLAAFGMSHTTMPITLRQLLTSPAIRKVANNIRGDAARLFASHALNLQNCADLSYIARNADPARWPLKVSRTQRLRLPRYWLRTPNYVADNTRALERLTFAYTRHVLLKDSALEDWHSVTLSERMLQYAVDDAHATLKVYSKLVDMPSFNDVPFHRYAFEMFEGKPYHIGIAPRKAWRADNVML